MAGIADLMLKYGPLSGRNDSMKYYNLAKAGELSEEESLIRALQILNDPGAYWNPRGSAMSLAGPTIVGAGLADAGPGTGGLPSGYSNEALRTNIMDYLAGNLPAPPGDDGTTPAPPTSPWTEPPPDPTLPPPGAQLPGLQPSPPTGPPPVSIPVQQPVVPVQQTTGTSPVAVGPGTVPPVSSAPQPPVPDISVPQVPPRPFGLESLPSWYLDPLPMQSYLTYGYGPEHTFFKPERAATGPGDVTTPDTSGLGGGIAAIDPSLYMLYDQNLRRWYGGYN